PRTDVLQNELVMSSEQHSNRVSAVGKATKGTPFRGSVRHDIEKPLEHHAVGAAQRLVVLHRDQSTVILLVRPLEKGQGYTNEIARHDLPGGYRQAITSATFVAVEENENRKLTVARIIGWQCSCQAG